MYIDWPSESCYLGRKYDVEKLLTIIEVDSYTSKKPEHFHKCKNKSLSEKANQKKNVKVINNSTDLFKLPKKKKG